MAFTVSHTLQKIKPVLNSYAEIFFLKGSLPGLLILLITFLHPHAGAAGIIAIVSAYVFAHFIGYHAEFLQSGYYTYNPLLVGLSIGALFEISLISIPFIAISAILTFIITISLANIFYRFFQLQILSIPFVMVSSLIYLAASRFSNLYVNDLYMMDQALQVDVHFLPSWIIGFLKSLGSIVFMPNVIAGAFIFIMIIISSRILIMLAFTGFMVGTLIQGVFTGSFESAFYDIAAFNYCLIAMAVGGVFNIPCMRSYILAMCGVALSTVLIKSTDVFWSQYGVPAFTLPFTVITLGMVYVLGLLHYPLRPFLFKNTPEHTAEYFHTARLRYATYTMMHLPFLDEWTVWQGFDGKWTHKGLWKYAIDFVKKDESGKTHHGKGTLLSDYYCFHQTVCSPVRGYVVYTAGHFPDNSIGNVDTINNWGNYVVIQDQRGFYISICHLAQHHVYVKPGDWVEPYQIIGLCGNSGYSPQPHIHMQYQTTAYITSATMPFCFQGVVSKNNFKHYINLEEDDVVRPSFTHPFYIQVTNFLLDEQLIYDVSYKGRFLKQVCFTSQMAFDGTFYLEHNGSRLYLGKTDKTFYFYHIEGDDFYLKLLYQALPSVPLNYLPGVQWEDFVPAHYINSFWHQIMSQVKSLFKQQTIKNNAVYHFKNDATVLGSISSLMGETIHTKIMFDPYTKFSLIETGDYQFTIHTPN